MNRRLCAIAGLCAALVFASCARLERRGSAAPSAPLYFVQLSDCHFGSREHRRRVERIVDAVNALPLPLACVVVTGDMVSDNILNPAITAEATSTLARLRVPVHYLPGNHDILARRAAETVAAYTNAFGPLASRAEYGGVVFLMLYTEPLRSPVAAPGYEPLTWLQEQLAAAGRKPVLVFHHTPSVEDFYGNAMHPGWPAAARAAWERLLRSANVRAVVAGHFHRDELHWCGDIPCYVASSTAGYWGRQASFRIYEYRNGRLGYRTVYLEPTQETDAVLDNP